jgi:hypothetical protein
MNKMTQNDSELLKNYFQMRSEAAFAELVRRHIASAIRLLLRQKRWCADRQPENLKVGTQFRLAKMGRAKP